ncbi:lytic transglycosylase domain-containing protein [Kineococcus endophyticus]|uniref:Lytic transglycosylase domain-containing protein n=1 Tax=Kineococcus endophyticus TaxID=1181883 RepID=A0ABV3P812_9ACTN
MTTRAPARVRTAALLLAAASGAGLLAAGPASADPGRTAAQARADAAAAVSAAQAAGSAVARAQDELTRSTAAVGSAVSQSVQAQVEADRSAAQAEREKAAATARVRSLYMDGALGAGTAGARRGLALLSSAVSGGDPAVAERAFAAVRRTDRERVAQQEAGASAARQRALDAQSGATAAVATMRDVAAQVSRADDALRLAQSRVEALQGEAARLQAAEDAAAALAAAQAAAASLNASAAGRAATVHARGVPADYAGLYVRGAATCPGMRPELLAAVGQVESGHGVNTGPSSAGAVGPMQFMPATFAAYAVDGDGDGDVDAQDPADAVFTAAAYLCANGAGKGREAEASAVFRYNHADWYVQMVQRVADELAAQGFGS